MTRTDSQRVRRRASGFTLIELMVVLVLMALLATMIAPSVASGLQRGGLKTTRDKLCEVLDFAYMSAVTRHRPVVVNLDPGRRLCWVSSNPISLPWLANEPAARTQVLATMPLPEEVQIAVTRGDDSSRSFGQAQVWETVTFESDGQAEDAVIELTDRQGERVTIQVIGITGEVHAGEDAL